MPFKVSWEFRLSKSLNNAGIVNTREEAESLVELVRRFGASLQPMQFIIEEVKGRPIPVNFFVDKKKKP